MNWIVLIIAIVISFLLFTWLLRVVKATLTTALTIAFLILIVQLVFGIGPSEFGEQIKMLWQNGTQ
ncbi:MAG: hypothetical protein F6K09_21870 [Merismopedia sp. SIO2A8]|nr:hypothetical protein [Symploca sp. SIO2B6]NET51273.1 hypothetical protein [Merismopedia sp. SIO2A8]